MILIADSGSTKCDWVLIQGKKNIDRVRTKGLNPAIQKKQDIIKVLKNNVNLKKYKAAVSTIYFFGAGCITDKSKAKISEILLSQFPNTEKINVYEDLMLAVLSVTSKPAIVSILGTGSNCCFFDGEKIQQKNLAMGYLLMDEGSGNHLGKKLLNKYFYNKVPEDLKFSLEKEFNTNSEKVLSKLYSSKAPNKYLAKYARFLFENKEHPFCKEIINESINEFIDNQLILYKEEIKTFPIYFIGSVAYFAQGFINSNLNRKNIKKSNRFIRRPLGHFIDRVKNEENFLKEI